MSQELFLLLAMNLLVGYWLITGSGRRSRPRSEEIARAIRAGERELDEIFERGMRRVNDATRRK